ncbi:hypothetical protein K435DRAFT_871016 [Dendrothele bispora CBS 962.96]|uniref:Uncharacterized protein n=1 Tax=Dendrothele bispora (strain CBS 962.96) TaxID=1314807 RepID=A0A4S8L6K1_DENBC|nr:hypothetical protein K435DRAFT_871016 [Dendrothele bispora CBS 962.96]
MSNSVLSQDSLAFVNSLSLTEPLRIYPRWFQSTNTQKANDAVVCALVQHFYPAIEDRVKCPANSTITHKWEIVMGRDDKNRIGDLRRSTPDQEYRPCPVRNRPCKYIYLPEDIQLQVRTAYILFDNRREAERKMRKNQRRRESRAAAKVQLKARQGFISTVSRGTAPAASSKGKQRARTPVFEERAFVPHDLPSTDSEHVNLPSTDSEHAELIEAIHQIHKQDL